MSEQGLFAVWQPQYAALGLPTFPVTGKKPAVRGYLRLGLRSSAKLSAQFSGANSFGVALGPRTNLTVVDIDTIEEEIFEAALKNFGDTPFVVRSGSGHFQAWYRFNGERRLIRPFEHLPVDILGRGFVVAPPSNADGREYMILRGSLADLASLPKLRQPTWHLDSTGPALRDGRRNTALWRIAMSHAPHVDEADGLLDVVQTENVMCSEPPLEDKEIAKIVKSAWRYQSEGRNHIGESSVRATRTEVDDLACTKPDALALLLILRRYHKRRRSFVLGKAMARKMSWTLRRFKAARAHLEATGYIRCLHNGGRGPNDPPIYSLQGVRKRTPI